VEEKPAAVTTTLCLPRPLAGVVAVTARRPRRAPCGSVEATRREEGPTTAIPGGPLRRRRSGRGEGRGGGAVARVGGAPLAAASDGLSHARRRR